LKNRIKQILNSEDLDAQRELISSIATELEIDSLTCAAALLYLTQTIENTRAPDTLSSGVKKADELLPTKNRPLGIKMVRYRLDVGSKHSITLEQLKKVLVEESGVDKNNINNVNIQSLYTLIELPDEMPPEIFQHLKSVEINQHKLDIKRVKARNKKRFMHHMRRGQNRGHKPGNEISDQVDGCGNKAVE
jgi:hypothetical protein